MSHQTVARGIHAMSNIQVMKCMPNLLASYYVQYYSQKFTLIRLSSSNVTKQFTLNCDPSENAHDCFAHEGLSF